MKRAILAGAAALLLGVISIPAESQAQANVFRENVGCGLGSMLLEERDSIIGQIFAVTTNSILGNQTFGISSGTLGCVQPTRLVKDERLNRFVADNMDILAQDMAMGSGETLDALAELMAVPQGKKPEFFASLQANFPKIYPSGDVKSAQVIDAIVELNS